MTVPAFAQSGAVEGSVADAVTKAPIAGAAVRLFSGEKTVASGKSDASGLFHFAGLADGQYYIRIFHDGHLPLAADHAAARTFTIAAAAEPVRLKAELTPLAEIGGRVLSPAREPVKGVPVGLRRLWDEQWTQTTITGDDGRFRVPRLEPGTWILAAIPSFRIRLADPKKNPEPIADPAAEEGQRAGWAATFFPGVVDLAAAEKIVLRPGVVLDGYDVKLRTVPLRRVSGVVTDEDGKPVPKAMVALSDVTNQGANAATITADLKGRFEFDAGKDGDWRIFGQAAPPGQTLKGYAECRVSRSDVTGIEVRLTRPFPVKGFVERDEPRDPEGNRKVSAVYLIPQAASRDVQATAFHEQDGSFVLKNVYRGRYRVFPMGYVPGYYVASIWYGGQDVTTQAIEIVNPPSPLKIVYHSGAGRAAGTVERGEGTWVALVPQDEAFRDSSQFLRIVKCGAHGKFEAGSLRPGGYYAFAFDRVRSEMLGDVEFVRKLAAHAVRVDVRHGETVHLELRPQAWPDY